RLLSVTDSAGHRVSYAYDAAGRRVGLSAPGGREVRYRYDAAGRLSAVDSFLGAFGFAYDAAGRRTRLSFPNGIETAYSTDAAGRLVGISSSGGRHGKALPDLTYELDPVGLRVLRVLDRRRTAYAYDALDRLVEVRPGDGGHRAERYAYDLAGNCLSGPRRHDAYAYDGAGRLVSGPGFTCGHDAAGRLVRKVEEGDEPAAWTYAYDALGRLVRATRLSPSGETLSVDFTYDPFGRRIGKRVERTDREGEVRVMRAEFVYDGAVPLLETREGKKPVTTWYLFVPGSFEPLALEQEGRAYFYHLDGL
ncbi:RHS repeat protein, partial [Dissulfurirhabdus thermomarina]|nr:RHS repeat protein [Dissulfurirhabdus thermomarina]